jgi:hypothetical protein
MAEKKRWCHKGGAAAKVLVYRPYWRGRPVGGGDGQRGGADPGGWRLEGGGVTPKGGSQRGEATPRFSRNRKKLGPDCHVSRDGLLLN